MASPELLATNGLRIAVEGCGHGTLHAIYASIDQSCKLKGWDGVDLLIIGGDFQAVRNALDLKAIAMPAKFHDMQDFHEYYSGARVAPYLTIFIGGNHEASNYLWELFYGGWVAPRIYYMGAANVIRLGPLRIAGLSGIWKGYSYRKPHFERLPYNGSDMRSIYHVREWDTRKLLQICSQVDIGISHDWPRGMEWKGNFRQLFRFKPDFEEEAKEGTLGNVAALKVLEQLRPPHWFSAHMHAKYAAVWEHHGDAEQSTSAPLVQGSPTVVKNEGEIDLDLDDEPSDPVPKNEADIEIDLDDEPGEVGCAEVSQDVRDLLPAAFARPTVETPQSLPFPTQITNKTTRFLALNKCLPGRDFLQLLEVVPHDRSDWQRPLQLEYDTEWLAITRVFASDLQVGDPNAPVSADKGDAFYRPLIEKEMEWVEQNIVKAGKTVIPEDFERTAPVYDATQGIQVSGEPQEYTNPHTQTFCDLLQIPNPFHASDEERAEMLQRGARPDEGRPSRGRGRDGSRGGHRGGHRGGGRGNRGSVYTTIHSTPLLHFAMTSKFTEILEPSEAPTYTHPHLNVSLEDVLAEEGRKRSASQSSHSSGFRSGSDSPNSPTDDTKEKSSRRRAFTFGTKKDRRVS
ncbi:DBR1-domain-containing protein [Polyplosphaeria fusca]|uniref:DBR1-domain-containing protein n=1 Tax=Polyplosphaeria fusca TaxID=682080 RepID=A0A9P4RA02_9PLEO|nr:DBR1-domain-containing protein [Polyplosphaeria fusca]